MYSVHWSTRFKKDIKRLKKQNKDFEKFKTVNEILISGKELSVRYRDHELVGNWSGHRECHIEPDWLVIYRIDAEENVIEYVRTGSHSQLYK